MSAVLNEIIDLLVGGIAGVAEGIGGGLTNLVSEIFLNTTENGDVTGLSIFGGVIVIFAGVSLAIGLSKMVVNWVTSLGN